MDSNEAYQLVLLVQWTSLALPSLSLDRRFSGDEGRRRLLEMDEWDARHLQHHYRARGPVRLLVAMGAAPAAAGVWWLATGDVIKGGLAVVVVAVLLHAWRTRRLVAPHVLAVLAERDLPTGGLGIERSARRRRRLVQFGTAAAVSGTAGLAVLAIGATRSSGVGFVVVGLVLVVLSLTALVAAAWASAWRFGDETPVDD